MRDHPIRDVPSGWGLASLDAVTELTPRFEAATRTDNPNVSFVPMPAVEAGTGVVDVSRMRRLEEVRKGYTHFREGDVLFAKITPCMENGKMAVVPPLENDLGFGSTEFHVLRPYRGISPQYIYHYVSSQQFRSQAQHNMTGAVGQRRVPGAYLADQSVPIPPSREQRRIVAKIEELFSELNKGIESLKTARRQLEVYRHAVLKHAFEGKLTAQWREDNKDKLETPQQMLARIKRYRAAHYRGQLDEWEAAVREWQEGGKTGTKPPKPKPPANIDDMNAGPPDLPGGWGRLRLDCIADVVGGITKNQARSKFPRKMKYLRVANVYADKVVTTNVHEIGVTDVEASKVALKVGDLLVVEGNGSMEQIGRVAMWDGQLPVCGHQNHLIRVRVVNGSDPRFVLLFLLSPQGRGLIVKEASSTSGLHTLSISRVSNLIVPVASPSEERAVVAEIDQKVEGLNRSLGEIDGQLAKSEALRQSILKKAFSGQLVTQDPKDEPASVLLQRIKAKRNSQTMGYRMTKVTETIE